MTKLSIVILNYNTKDFLKNALASIKKKREWEVIVIDNASTDGSIKMVAEKFPWVKYIVNQKNSGFAAGNNVGLKKAKGEYLMLLNSDTKVINDALEKLVHFLDTHPDAGVVTPKLILPDGAIDLACHRGFPTPWNSLAYFVKLEQTFPNNRLFAGYHRSWEDFTITHEVDAVSGAALMTRRVVTDEVGLLDEAFFLYAEDIDWCKRIKDHGWKIVYYPDAEILHYKSASGKAKGGERGDAERKEAKYHFRNTMKQYFDKHYQYPFFIKKAIHAIIDIFSKLR